MVDMSCMDNCEDEGQERRVPCCYWVASGLDGCQEGHVQENEGDSFQYMMYDGVMMVDSLSMPWMDAVDGCREFGLEGTVGMMVVINCGWLECVCVCVCVCSVCEREREDHARHGRRSSQKGRDDDWRGLDDIESASARPRARVAADDDDWCDGAIVGWRGNTGTCGGVRHNYTVAVAGTAAGTAGRDSSLQSFLPGRIAGQSQ